MFNSRTSVVHWLWIHNPFYVISALLMLYAVRAGYSNVEIGSINCWMMMGILGGYTLLLASVGVLIIRWGKVWDDARSILLVTLLLFLAVSVSADDLFVKMESGQGGAALMGCGFGFSVAVLLGILKAARIRLGTIYVVPLILFLALFFAAPWWCSPELNPKNAMTLDWTLFLFPQVAAVIVLTLIPAARMGQKAIEGNGTPWPWPLFPWSAFVFIGVAVVLRSYALTMTFSQSGPIWTSSDSRSGIAFDTIWRPYFLVPLALSVLILMIEAGLASGNRRLVRRALSLAPALLLMGWPWNSSDVMTGFMSSLTATLGSPVWLTVCLLTAFYGWAVIRKAENAEIGLLSSILLLSVVGPNSIDFATFTSPNPVSLLIVGLVLGIAGLRRRSTILMLGAAGLVSVAISVLLPQTMLAAFRMATLYHLLLATCVLLSIVWADALARWLQTVSALMLMVSAFMAFNGTGTAEIPMEWRIVYVASLSLISFTCAVVSRGPAYWTGFLGTTSVLCYALAVECFRNASTVFGRSATTAFSWSAGTLIIGVLISAHKARWLPKFAWLGAFDPNEPHPETGPERREVLPDDPLGKT